MEELLDELQHLQSEAVSIVKSSAEENYNKQYHPDLSPLGWHLGHCIFIEHYWIKEQCLREEISDSLKSLYFPELSHKTSRGEVLPEKAELIDWAKQSQKESRELLKLLLTENNDHYLLENNFLIHFLIQHYSQHIETMTMVMTEIQLRKNNLKIMPEKHSNKEFVRPEFKLIDAGVYKVGSNNKELSYDNERPAHEVTLNRFKISSLPVNNKEYLQFINNDGYATGSFWSKQGWKWIKKNQFKHPHHWRMIDSDYYGINHKGIYSLDDNQPVHGLSFYEAEAYANWKGARLPHEHEWEVAELKNHLEQTGTVWEWCRNSFYPYNGFQAYPYEGYSVPYFDNKHYVLRGGSSYTKKRIKRSSFRNYYSPDKRHLFAGVRLAFD